VRSADVAKNRADLLKATAKWPTRIERLEFEGVPNLGSGELTFDSPLSVLCGTNGAGKTTLLRCLWAVLDPNHVAGTPGTIRKLRGGKANLDIWRHGKALSFASIFTEDEVAGDAEHEIPIVHIDASGDVLWQINTYDTYPGLENYTEGLGHYELDAGEMETVRFLARRNYDSVAVYESEFQDRSFPFFSVSYADGVYDSRTMGTGELAALFLWWALKRAEKNSILLVEEPESFLSPVSQGAFCAVLTAHILNSKSMAVISSHSAAIIDAVSRESLQFVGRDGTGVVVHGSPGAIDLSNLGVKFPADAIVLVEDHAAAELAKFVISKFDSQLSHRLDIIVMNGEATITSALQAMPSSKRVKVLGLYDGDMRGRPVVGGLAERTLYLPGEHSIESIFRTMIGANSAPIAAFSGTTRINQIMGALEGQEDHDWYEEFCRELGLTKQQAFPPLLSQWMTIEGNEEAAKQSYDALVAALSG
jgi:predicted ATPase